MTQYTDPYDQAYRERFRQWMKDFFRHPSKRPAAFTSMLNTLKAGTVVIKGNIVEVRANRYTLDLILHDFTSLYQSQRKEDPLKHLKAIALRKDKVDYVSDDNLVDGYVITQIMFDGPSGMELIPLTFHVDIPFDPDSPTD